MSQINLGGQFVLLWVPAQLSEQNLDNQRSLSADPSSKSWVQASVGDASISTVLQVARPEAAASCSLQIQSNEHGTQHLQYALQPDQFHHTVGLSKVQSEEPVLEPHNNHHVKHVPQQQVFFKHRFLQHPCTESTQTQPQRLHLADFLCKSDHTSEKMVCNSDPNQMHIFKSEQPIQKQTTNKVRTHPTTYQQLQTQASNLKATTHTAIPLTLPSVNTSILAREHISNQQPSLQSAGGCNDNQRPTQQRSTGNSKLVLTSLIGNTTKSSEQENCPLNSGGMFGYQELGVHNTNDLRSSQRQNSHKHYGFLDHERLGAHEHPCSLEPNPIPTPTSIPNGSSQYQMDHLNTNLDSNGSSQYQHQHQHHSSVAAKNAYNLLHTTASAQQPGLMGSQPPRMLPLQHLHRGNSQASRTTNSRIDENYEDDDLSCFCATPEPSPRMWTSTGHIVPHLPCADGPVEVESSPSISIRSVPEGCTTLVIRNIPARYNQDMLLHAFREDVGFNLVILPFCTRSNRTMGYTFINFLNDTLASRFQSRWHHQYLPNHGRTKHLDVTVASVQGLHANLRQFNTRSVSRLRRSDMLPAFFNEQGQRLDALSELRRHGVIKSRSQ